MERIKEIHLEKCSGKLAVHLSFSILCNYVRPFGKLRGCLSMGETAHKVLVGFNPRFVGGQLNSDPTY